MTIDQRGQASRPRKLRSAVSALAAVCLGYAGLTTYGTDNPADHRSANRPAPIADVSIAADSAQAHRVAAKFGHRVQIADRNGVNYSVYANPDGTLTARLESHPIRTTKSGHLVDIDPTLAVAADGWVRPKAIDAAVRLSGGSKQRANSTVPSTGESSTPASRPAAAQSATTTVGPTEKPSVVPGPSSTGPIGQRIVPRALAQAEGTDPVTPLAVLTFSTGSVSYGWYGELPVPTLSGSTATYAEVLPGIDLQVDVSDGGFEILLVINSEQATADLASIDFPVTVTDLAVSTDAAGNATFTDAGGAAIGAEPAPFLWDASIDEHSGDPHTAAASSAWDATGSAVAGSHETVQHVGLPTAFLADPSTEYPVTVDPTLRDVTKYDTGFDYVDQHYPNQTYWLDNWDAGRLHVGAEPGLGTINRAYWMFPGTIFAGQHIYSAHFNTTEQWSYSCTATQVDVYHSDDFDNTLTWNTMPNSSGSWASATVAKGYSSACPSGAVGFDVSSLITTLAAQDRSVFSLVLRAHNEADQTAWKKFNSTAWVEVQFNSYPDAPTALRLGLPASTCGGYPGPAVNNAVQDIKLTMNEQDVDDQGVDVHVKVVNASNNVNVLPAASYPAGYLSTGTFGANGDMSVKILRNSLPQGSYAYYAYGYDGIDTGPQSAVCYFSVDDTPPAAPSVRVVGLPPSAVGKVVAMKLSSVLADKVTEFTYWWDPVAKASSPPPVPVAVSGVAVQTQVLPSCPSAGTVGYVCPAGTTGAATIWVAPPDSPATLWVASFDSAQNVSVATGYQFWAPGDSGAFGQGHSWQTDVTGHLTSTQLTDSSTVTDPSCSYTCPQAVTLHSATVDATDNPRAGDSTLAGSLQFNGTTGTGASATTAGPAIDTSKAFTVSAWVRPAALNAYQTAVSQDGGTGKTISGFYLQISSANQWRMCMPRTFTATFVGDCATAAGTVTTAGAWAFLTGVWDPVNQQIRLYLNGALAGTETHPSTPVTSGSFVLGRAFSGTQGDWFHGLIADVSVVQGVADSVQQSFLRLQCPTTGLTCRLLPGD